MNYHKLLEPLRRRMATMIGRCILGAVNSGGGTQAVTVTIMADEIMDGVEHMEPYGFTSNPLPGAEGVILNVSGQRAACVAVNLGNRAFRLAGLNSGEVALYTDEGDKLVFERGNTVRLTTKRLIAEVAEKTTVDCPEVALTGHLTVLRGLTWGEAANGLNGPGRMTGGLTNDGGTVKSNGIMLETHVHTQVEPGPGNTGGPQ